MKVGRNSSCPCGSGLKYKKCCGQLRETSSSQERPDANRNFLQTSSLTTVRIAGNVLITVPDSLELITPYVLKEQEEWFEDEIVFVKQLLRPGARVIDVGANYGVYTLPMALGVGDHGHVWAFEPATSTMRCLKASIALNHFKNVTAIHAALSSCAGTANLRLNRNSELNSLTSGVSDLAEKVSVTTLDHCMSELALKEIEFIKLDAEGEEQNILLGGKELLSAESPLIMFELKHGSVVNTGLINQFADLGYSTYRLIPGLNLLVPFNHGEDEESPDPYLLNLFCCKDDRATKLENAGWLVRHSQNSNIIEKEDYDAWENAFYSLPFARRMRDHWKNPANRLPDEETESFSKAIELYFLAHSDSCVSRDRYNALHASFNRLKKISGTSQKLTYLSTFARVADEIGFRNIAVQTIAKQLEIVSATRRAQLDEPFLPACSRFDHLDPGDRLNDWFLASLLEAFEARCAYSSYYTGQSTLGNLEMLRSLGFQSPEMERRRQLIKMRYKLQFGSLSLPLLSKRTESNLNPELWNVDTNYGSLT